MISHERFQKLLGFRTNVCPGVVGFQKDHLQRALEAGGTGVWQLDFTTGLLVVSDLCAAHFGRQQNSDVVSAGMLLATLHPDDQQRQIFAFRRAVATGTELDIRCRSVWPDGSLHWIHLKGCIVSGRPLLMVGTSREVTDEQRIEEGRRKIQAQMAYRADHDALTGLKNRARVDRCLRDAADRPAPFALLYLDLDAFKRINDTMGHQVGDFLLNTVARRLEGCVRDRDIVGRYGGDEFVVIQSDARCQADAAQLARRIIAALGQRYDIGGQSFEIGVSVGIALVIGHSRQADDVLKDADAALYRAKRAGGGVFRFSRPGESDDPYYPTGRTDGIFASKTGFLQFWARG